MRRGRCWSGWWLRRLADIRRTLECQSLLFQLSVVQSLVCCPSTTRVRTTGRTLDLTGFFLPPSTHHTAPPTPCPSAAAIDVVFCCPAVVCSTPTQRARREQTSVRGGRRRLSGRSIGVTGCAAVSRRPQSAATSIYCTSASLHNTDLNHRPITRYSLHSPRFFLNLCMYQPLFSLPHPHPSKSARNALRTLLTPSRPTNSAITIAVAPSNHHTTLPAKCVTSEPMNSTDDSCMQQSVQLASDSMVDDDSWKAM